MNNPVFLFFSYLCFNNSHKISYPIRLQPQHRQKIILINRNDAHGLDYCDTSVLFGFWDVFVYDVARR